MKTKVLALTLALVSVLILASCGKSNEPPQITAPNGETVHKSPDREEESKEIEYPKAPYYYDGIYESGYNFIVYYNDSYDNPYLIQLFLDGGVLKETIETKNAPKVREGISASDDVVLAVVTAENDDEGHLVTFYDITNGKKTEPLKDFVGAAVGYAVFAEDDGFLVKDFFDDSVFCKKFTVNSDEYDKSKIKHATVMASPNGKNIVVSYTIDGVSYDQPFKLK